MYPALPFGPITLPTGPIFALLAVYFGLNAAARFGRGLGLRLDDVWNTGLLAVAAGLIVARLWNVIQFWYVYVAEPQLIVSPRPSGFAFWPGAAAALLVGYAYLLWRAVDPVKMAASMAVGLLMLLGILGISDYLAGAVTGEPSNLPWALPYFGEMQHPAGLYRALGFLMAMMMVWLASNPAQPGRTVLLAGVACGLVYLIADGAMANAALLGPFRASQLAGFLLALLCAALLARNEFRAPRPAAPAEADRT